MSYLGKISALVSVNTGDFGPKLNSCARDVRTFAQVVQREIGSSMRDANKAFEGIYTPLQRFERAMRAASSAKLSFVGMPGAIRSVDELQRKLGTLNNRQVAVVLKASGMKSLDDFRTAIQGLTTKNLNILAKVGGLDELKQLREQMVGNAGAVEFDLRTNEARGRLRDLEEELVAARQAASGIPLTMKVDQAGLDRMAARMDALTQRKGVLEDARQNEPFGSDRAERLGRIIDKIDEKIDSVSSKHLAAQAIADADRLAGEVETARIEVAALQEQFEKKVGKDAATGLNIRSVDDAIKSLSGVGISGEAARKVIDALLQSDGSAFVAMMRQTRSAAEGVFKPLSAVQDTVAKLSPEVQAGFLPALKRAQSAAESLKRTMEGQITPVADVARQYDAVLVRVKAVQAAAERVSEAAGMASQVKTGNELMFAAPALAATLGRSKTIGESAAGLSSETVAANPGVAQRLVEINNLTNKAVAAYARLQANIANNMPTDGASRRFEAALAALRALQDQAEQEIKVHVDSAEADKKFASLRDSLNAVRENVTFVITGKVQNLDQAKKEYASLLAEVGKFDDAQRKAFSTPLQKLGRLVEAGDENDLPRILALIDEIRTKASSQTKLNLNTEEADKKLTSLRDALRNAVGGIATPLSPMDALKKSADDAQKAIDKVSDATKRAQLQARANSVAATIQTLSDPNNPALKSMSPRQVARAQARATGQLASITADASAKTSDDIFGNALNSSAARADALQKKIAGIQTSVAALPGPFQREMIPALNRVRDIFTRLGDNPTARQLRDASREADNLEKRLKRVQAASNFSGTMRSFINDSAEKRYKSMLDAIQSGLLAVGATAGGPVAAAVNQYEKALQKAAKAGRLGTQDTKKEMEDLLVEIQKVAVASGLMNDAQAKAFAQSVKQAGKGDVGRGGADKFSLALNQAAFAVDDFMSSTGGIEFKLRAISNNITQLAFVLGGTTGLFVGLGAVIASTAAVSIIKWINNGRTAEDQTKALNDSLTKQKTLVEDLAQAFGDLGDAINRGAFSAGAQRAVEFEDQLGEVKKKQKELRDEQAASLDPTVQRERAQQGAFQKRLEDSTDIGARIVLAQQIRESKERERRAAEAAASRAPASGVDSSEAIRRAGDVLFSVQTQGEETITPRDAAVLTAARERANAAAAAASPAELRKSLMDQRSELQGGGFADNPRVAEQVRQLTVLIQSLEGPVERAIDELSNQIAQASRGAAVSIESAQADVASAIERGVKGAADFQAALDNTSQQLKDAQKQLEEAQKIEGDPERRQQEVERAQSRVDDVRMRQDAIAERAREVRLGRTFGGERTTQALSQLQGNERFANEYAGLTATVTAAVAKEVDARAALQAAVASGDDAQQAAARAALEAAQAESDLAAAAAEAALALEQAVTRIRKIGADAISESERMADDAQKRLNENPTFENSQARDRAELQLIGDRERLAQANNALDRRRSEIAASNPAIAAIDREMADVRNRREQLAEQARISGVQADPAEMERLANREAALMADRERQMQSLTAAERQQQDAIAQEIAARRRLVEEAEKQRQAEIERGRQRDEQAFGVGGQRSQIDQAMSQAQQAADQARARFISRPTAANRQARDEADGRLRAATQRSQELQDELDAAERRFTGRDDIRQEQEAIRRRDRERADIIAGAKEGNRELTPQEQARIDAIDEANREARAEVDRKRRDALKPEQEAADKFAQQQDILARNEAGRRLGLTERERFREDMEVGIGADIRARAAVLQRDGGNPNAFINRALSEQMKTVAPMLEEFRMERETAMLQGPSRAALQISDVTTSQGQSELNRLLRGDDAAKDVNLAELRKQSDLFQELINVVRNNPLPVLP